MAWIPSNQLINDFVSSWNSRKVLAEVRKNADVTTLQSFKAGLTRLLLAACRENDVAVLRVLLPLSLRHYDIDHCYTYRVRTGKKAPNLIHAFHSFCPNLTWRVHNNVRLRETTRFLPSVELQGTLLHIAAQEGHLKVAQFLLNEGAKIDAVNCCGRTPLMMGIHKVDVANYFIRSGCNVNHQDKWGQTPLMLVVWKAKTCKALLKPLLEAGADPKMVDQYGKTMVHYACELIIDGEIVPFLIENNLLDVEYGENGKVLYAGIPLIINHGFTHFRKSRNAQFPPVFYAYLAYCELLSTGSGTHDDFQKIVIQRVRELGVAYQYAPAESVYGYRREITTIDEFELNLAAPTNLEVLYQRLIIAERLVGPNSQECISLLWAIMGTEGDNIKSADQICRWLDKLNCFLEKYRSNNSTMELFSHLNFEKLTAVGLTRQHKLWFEFLSKYAKTVKLLANRVVHAHRYTLSPVCDVAVSPFGTTYALQNTSAFIPKAVLMLFYLIFKVNDKFDEGLFQALVSQSLVHQYSPPVFKQGYALVQSSSILHTYLEKCQPVIDGHDIKVCAKICEMSTVDLINAPVPNRQTLLHFAVENNNIQLVDFLLDRGAHPDAVDSKGWSPAKRIIANANSNSSASLNSVILSKLVPDRLFCIAARSIVNGGLPYRKLGLPNHIVKRILYHDKRRFF